MNSQGNSYDEEDNLSVDLDRPRESTSLDIVATSKNDLDDAKNQNTSGPSPTNRENIRKLFQFYIHKFKGVPDRSPPKMTSAHEMIISSTLAFVGIFLVSLVDYWYLKPDIRSNGTGINMLTGAYAATSVLIYEAYQSPLAQPRNVMASYIIASFVGVSTRLVCDTIGINRYITGPLAVAFALFFMNVTKTVHPPGGACALIAVIGGKVIEDLGYAYMLTSIGAAFIMLCVALIGNNLIPTRQYPLYWY